ncbi:hypothetical protein BDC45DRAFT_566192 [Circinella umbellata]|nr:hypothetical protein BDC45DRAFT_566192 [Circinella umbellata]
MTKTNNNNKNNKSSNKPEKRGRPRKSLGPDQPTLYQVVSRGSAAGSTSLASVTTESSEHTTFEINVEPNSQQQHEQESLLPARSAISVTPSSSVTEVTEEESLSRPTSVATVISPPAAAESLDSNISHRNDLTDSNDNEEDEILVLNDDFFGSEESADMNAVINDINAAEKADEPTCPPGSVIDQYLSNICSKFKKENNQKSMTQELIGLRQKCLHLLWRMWFLIQKSYIIILVCFYGTLIILWGLKTFTVLTANPRLK